GDRGVWEEEEKLIERYLEKLHADIATRPSTYLQSADVQVEEEVFKNVFIPRTLEDVAVVDAERDVQRVKEGNATSEDLIYQKVTGLAISQPQQPPKPATSAPLPTPQEEHDSEASGSESEDDDEDSEDEEDQKGGRLKKDEDKDAKKERKKAVKEERREKRKNKIPKAVKKRKEKVSSGKKKK
ncbi:hypothetical protein HK097_005275, partial [Rhizophlyctis rosea]